MRKLIVSSLVVGGVCAGVGIGLAAGPGPAAERPQAQLAADAQPPQKVEGALKRTFLGYDWKVIGQRQFNGISIFDVQVSNKFGQSIASVTEHGDFLVSGIPTDPARVPGPVHAVVDKLFKAPPADVNEFTVTNYLVDLDVAGKTDRVVIDAVGRVLEIHPAGQLKKADELFSREREVKDPEQHRRMEAVIDRYYGEKDAAIEYIIPMPDVDNFYAVDYKGKNGQEEELVTNGNDIFSRRTTITEAEMPEPVKHTLHEMFNADKVVGVYRRHFSYFQFNIPAPANDVMIMRIANDGIVLNVNTTSALQEQTAAEQRNHELQLGHRPPQ